MILCYQCIPVHELLLIVVRVIVVVQHDPCEQLLKFLFIVLCTLVLIVNNYATNLVRDYSFPTNHGVCCLLLWGVYCYYFTMLFCFLIVSKMLHAAREREL